MNDQLETMFVVVGRPIRGRFGGRSRGPNYSTTSVTVHHGDHTVFIDVDTSSRGRSKSQDDDDVLFRWLVRRWSDSSTWVFPMNMVVDRWTVRIPVDGAPHEFDVFGDEQVQVVLGEVRGMRVRIEARGVPIEGVELQSVPAPPVEPLVLPDAGG